MDTDKIKLLINNDLAPNERKEFIEEIESNPSLKMELAILLQIRNNQRDDLRRTLINVRETENSGYLSVAAFEKGETFKNPELPVSDKTIQDFLEDDTI